MAAVMSYRVASSATWQRVLTPTLLRKLASSCLFSTKARPADCHASMFYMRTNCRLSPSARLP
jgi:hypothetical protein